MNCEFGGVKITDGDGNIAYACTGAPGTEPTLTVESEPPGLNCTAGGLKITSESGVEYVCNGIDAAGTDGTDGISAFTVTTDDFTQPAVNANVTIEVVSSAWVAADEPLWIEGGGSYMVVSIPDATHIEVENLGYPDNASPAANISAGAVVTPSGVRGATGASPTGAQNVVAFTEEQSPGDPPTGMLFGAWTQKVLNTEYDPDNVATLVANQFTLPEGRWAVNGAFCADKCKIRIRLWDVTNNVLRLLTVNNVNDRAGVSIMFGAIEVPGGSPVMELEYYAINDGGGVFGESTGVPGFNEAYSSIFFTRVDFP